MKDTNYIVLAVIVAGLMMIYVPDNNMQRIAMLSTIAGVAYIFFSRLDKSVRSAK